MRVRARSYSRFVRLGLGALGIFLMVTPPVSGEGEKVSLSLAQGTHYFRRILHDLGLRPLHTFDQLADDPSKKLLIVLGDATNLDPTQVAGLVEQGCAILLATDRDCYTALDPFGVRVIGQHLRVSENTRFAYKSGECIFVQPQGMDSPLFENLAIEDGLSRVATNRPGYLVLSRGCKLQTLATFPASSRPISPIRRGPNFERRLLTPPAPLPFAVGGDWERGRVLILSDHSVFINAMMWQPNIDNFAFAYNCVNWLTGQGQRNEVLFLEEGQVQTLFAIPLTEPPLPPLPPLKAIVEAADKTLGDLERDNAFNRAIDNAVQEASPPQDQWERTVILTSALALAAFGLARLSQARHRQEKMPPRADSEPGPRAPALPSVFEQRHQSMAREGNFWEAARALARQGFESVLGPQFQRDQQPSARAVLALLAAPRSWWGKWRLRRRVNRLWRIAYSSEPIRISSRQLRRLGAEIEAMKAALARYGLRPGSKLQNHPANRIRETHSRGGL